jgi:S-formylglutathione hydrolase FrmB
VVFYDTFSQMEEVMGPGGQLYSFEAVFSPLTAEKAPAQLWNRKTGEIDLRTADAWKKYDIGLILRENWAKLGPELAGKLHIVMGDKDTFYLEGATRLVQSALKEMGSDADVQIVAGRDHSDILDRALAARIDRQIRETLIRNGIEPPVRKEGDEARAKAAD